MVRIPWEPEYPIVTERLILRPHRLEDLADLLVYHSDPEVVRYIPWPTRTRAETQAALEKRTQQGIVVEEGQWLVLAIVLRDSDRVIGEVLLKYDSEADAAGELGYAIARDVEGNGYATEATTAMLTLGFGSFGLRRIVARLDARNTASARLLERLGLRREALHLSDSFFKDEWTDTLVYAITAEEWHERDAGGRESLRQERRTHGHPAPVRHLIHHLGVFASDFGASEAFYTAALAPLGIEAGYRTDTISEYWIPGDDTPSLSLETAPSAAEVTRGLHLAFEAESTGVVDAFHRAAVTAGGVSRHAPQHWPQYRAYAAFISDPDGNNIEALIKDD